MGSPVTPAPTNPYNVNNHQINRVAVDPNAQAYFNAQSPEDQAAIRASWGGRQAPVGGGPLRGLRQMLFDNYQGSYMNQWYNNANAAGAIPPPPPVAPPPGPAQTAPVAGPVQPAQPPPQTASLRPAPAGQPAGGSTVPQPGQPGGSHGGYNPGGGSTPNHTQNWQPEPPRAPGLFTPPAPPGGTPITNMMTKKPFDYEAAKGQYGAAEAKRMESESR